MVFAEYKECFSRDIQLKINLALGKYKYCKNNVLKDILLGFYRPLYFNFYGLPFWSIIIWSGVGLYGVEWRGGAGGAGF